MTNGRRLTLIYNQRFTLLQSVSLSHVMMGVRRMNIPRNMMIRSVMYQNVIVNVCIMKALHNIISFRLLVSFQIAFIMAPSFINSSKIATAITCKSTRTNFLLWKEHVVLILRGVQLYGYLDGTTTIPAAMVTVGIGTAAKEAANPDLETWVVQDQAVLGGLLSSITEDVLSQLTCCIDTSNQLWTSLHTMFSAQHRGNSIQIRTQLSNTRKGDMSSSEYYQKMTGFADTMANVGHPMTDEEFIGYILAGLGPGHSDLFTAITASAINAR